MSDVQALSSFGRSPSSLTTALLPLPSHESPLQSFAVGSASLVPWETNVTPQTPAALQVRVRQALSVPGQSDATVQPTHWPLALHRLAPPHDVPAAAMLCTGSPALHRSSVHGFTSSGTSVSSLAVLT